MKTKKIQIVISKETANFAANKLAEIFPKLEKEPVYSLGFRRWSKLSSENKIALMFRNNWNYQESLNELEAR